jgi:hypothetical protein
MNEKHETSEKTDPTPQGTVQSHAATHERQDVNFTGVMVAIAIIALVLVGVASGSRWVLERERATTAKPGVAGSGETALRLPQQPRLEAYEPQLPRENSFAADQQVREARLHAYGQTTDKAFVHVPIEQAVVSLAKQVKSAGPRPSELQKSSGLVNGGDANSGRLFLEELR